MSDAATVPDIIHGAAADRRRRKRYAAERRLRLMGLGAIAAAIGLLAILVISLVANGYQAFTQTMITFDVTVDAGLVDRDDLRQSNWRAIANNSIDQVLPGIAGRRAQREFRDMFSSTASLVVRDRVMANPALVGEQDK